MRKLIGCGERATCGLTSPRVFMLFQEPDGRVVQWGGDGGLTRQEVQARYDRSQDAMPRARGLRAFVEGGDVGEYIGSLDACIT